MYVFELALYIACVVCELQRIKNNNNNNNNNYHDDEENNWAVLDRLVLPPDEGEPNAAECFVHNYQ